MDSNGNSGTLLYHRWDVCLKEVLPMHHNLLTYRDYSGRWRTRSVVPMSRQKSLEIGLGNAHQPIKPMRDQKPLLDPTPNRALAHPDALGDLFDREEFRWRL